MRDNPPLERTAAAVYFTRGRASRVRRRGRSTAFRYASPGLNVLEPIRRLRYPVEGSATPAPDDGGILLCEFHGVIRDGSAGNPAVEEMANTIERALAGKSFRAVLLDIGDVRYTFGDHAFGLLMNLRHRGINLALVVSEPCSQLGTFAERIGGWTVCMSRSEALRKLRPAAATEGDA